MRAAQIGPAEHVSILTRPEGRVQLTNRKPHKGHVRLFQSSPVPKDGCNLVVHDIQEHADKFQSSPVPKDGCNIAGLIVCLWLAVSILTRPEGRVQLEGQG